MLGSVQILCDPLRGRGESPKRSQKITRGGGGVHQKITEDHDHKEGGGKQKIGQIASVHKGNSYS